MMVPSPRLLWFAALVALPLATAIGLEPQFAAMFGWLLALSAIIVLVDGARGARRIAALGVGVPQSVRVTQEVPANLPLMLENRARHPVRLRIAVVMPPGIESGAGVRDASAPPGSSRLDWPCTGRERGDHRLAEIHIETPSPFGFWLARDRSPVECTFRVYPNLRDRATAALFLRTAQPGVRVQRQVGKGREFENLRHYMPGDGIEDVDWKATARRAFPVVKLYRVEHAQEVYAVIDTSRLGAREGILDGYVNAALHLALAAERQGDRFGLVTFSDRTHRLVRAASGMDHFRACRETIYNLRARRVSPSFDEVFTTLQLHLRRRSLLVFFTSLDDPLLAETFEREVGLLSRRHLVLVHVTQTAAMKPLFTGEPPADLDALYEDLGGQMLWNRMRTLAIALQNRGVKLTILDPRRIKTQVAAAYRDVKRRQAL